VVKGEQCTSFLEFSSILILTLSLLISAKDEVARLRRMLAENYEAVSQLLFSRILDSPQHVGQSEREPFEYDEIESAGSLFLLYFDIIFSALHLLIMLKSC